MTFSCSTAGIDFITQPAFDSFVAKPYQDSGGLWSVGFGTRINNPNEYPNGISLGDAKILLHQHIEDMCPQIDAIRTGITYQYQMDAICSLIYNIGVKAFKDSLTCRYIKQKDPLFETYWMEWVFDNKKQKQPGLVARRHKEVCLFIFGAYS